MVQSELLLAGHGGCLSHLQARAALPKCARLAQILARRLRQEQHRTAPAQIHPPPAVFVVRERAHV